MANPVKLTDIAARGDRPIRGICNECGKPAYAPQATKCEEHKQTYKPREKAKPTSDYEAPRVVTPPVIASNPDAEKRAKADRYKADILTTVNPALVQGFAFICKPIPADNFFTVVDPDNPSKIRVEPMGQQVEFDSWEAWVLGWTAAELESSPMVSSVAATAKPFVPILLAAGTAVILGLHGAKLVGMRDQLLKLYAEQQARTAAAQAPTEGQPAPQQPAAETAETDNSDIPRVVGF